MHRDRCQKIRSIKLMMLLRIKDIYKNFFTTLEKHNIFFKYRFKSA